MSAPAYSVAAIVLVIAATVLIGAFSLRLSRTTSDFYVASRSVSPVLNASAIGGEYLSAASFLGVAGLILAFGADMLWFPVGYTAGYLVLLVLVAAPLRRSGAYTLPDFAELRTESRTVRRIASILVVAIGWLYLLPQLVGAGLTVALATGAPAWVGALLVSTVVVFNVATGGMRSITFVQAFQYWLKITALAVPVIFLLLAWQADGAPTPRDGAAVFEQRTTVELTQSTSFDVLDPVVVRVRGRLTAPDGETRTYAAQPVALTTGTWLAGESARLTFPAGATVPHRSSLEASDGSDWARPLSGAGGRDHPLYATYSLILALFFGTMGLPHVLVRFYTNPDGRAARRTTLIVLCLLGAFYLLPTIYGALARVYTPDLLLTGRTDSAVLLLPERLVGGTGGQLLTALVTAGAFAAFLSTSSGLTVSVAGVLSQDVLRGSVRDFRVAAGLAVVVPFVLSLGAHVDQRGRRRRAGLRGGRVVVLPAAAARHLVARPDRCRRGRRAARRRWSRHRRGRRDDLRRRPRRLGGRAARAAGRVDGAGGLRGHGRGVAGDARPGRAAVSRRTMVRLHAPESVGLR